jgi:uncharacterized sporulation protein YeaH/YhbH (DUF444 family)
MDSMRELACAVALGDVAKAQECLTVVERDYDFSGIPSEIQAGRTDAINVARRRAADRPATLAQAA